MNPTNQTDKATTKRHWERGYHSGDLVNRSDMRIVAKFANDFERDLTIQAVNQYEALRAVVDAAKRLELSMIEGRTNYYTLDQPAFRLFQAALKQLTP